MCQLSFHYGTYFNENLFLEALELSYFRSKFKIVQESEDKRRGVKILKTLNLLDLSIKTR